MKFLTEVWNWIKSLFSEDCESEPIPSDPEPEIKPSKEDYYNDKYPKATIYYSGRTLPSFGSYKIDIRNFFINEYEELNDIKKIILFNLVENNDDNIALACQKWVSDNITYVSDKAQFGLEEFWMFAFETLKTRKGDCDDQAILLANLLLACGIDYWRVRLHAGNVYDQLGKSLGGHCWVNYYSEEYDKWVALDTCFFPDPHISVKDKPYYKDSVIYGRGECWFSWNKKWAFYKSTDTTALQNSKNYKGKKSNIYIQQNETD